MYFECPVRALVMTGAAALILSACSPASTSPQVAYRGAESERPLEVPPELIRPESPAAMRIPTLEEAEELLPQFSGIEVVRVGANSWLEMRDADPAEIWETIHAFLRSEGLAVRSQRPSTGVIETEWARRYDLPERGGFAGMLDNMLGRGDTGIEDRYHFRLERMEGGAGTRVFITHWMAEDRPRGGAYGREHFGFEWHYGSSDPAVVSEMQRRLLVYSGVRERQAARIVATGSTITVSPHQAEYEEVDGVGSVRFALESRERAQARLGDSLGQLGARIRESDPEEGVYRISWVAPGPDGGGGGIFGFFRGGGDEPRPRDYVVQMRIDGERARVVAAGADAGLDSGAEGLAGVPASGTAERALLQRLTDALNGVLVQGPVLADTRDTRAEPDDDRDAAPRIRGTAPRR